MKKERKNIVISNLVRWFFIWSIPVNRIWACRKSCTPSILLVSLERDIVLSSKFDWSHEAYYRRLTSSLSYGFVFARSSYRRSSHFAIASLFLLGIIKRSSNNLIYQTVPPLSGHHTIYSREVLIGGVGDCIGPSSIQITFGIGLTSIPCSISSVL